MNPFEIEVEPRADLGKGASRRLRRAGKAPAILYGGEKQAQSLAVSQKDLLKRLENEAFYSHILTLNIGGKMEKAVLKDLQRHPFKPLLLHVDFQRISESKKIHLRVPIHFVNADSCVGVKMEGGVISHQMVEIEVACLPKDLPEFITVDLAETHLGQTIHLSSLKLPEGIELPALLHGNDLPVVTVHKGHGGAMEEAAPAEIAPSA